MSTESKRVEGFQRVPLGQGDAWAGVSALSYALTAIFSRVASLTTAPFVALALRLLPVLTIAWTQAGRSRQGWRPLNPAAVTSLGWRVLLVLFLGGTLTTVIGTVGYFFALREGGVVLAQPVLATNILWSALVAAVFLKEPLALRMTAGILAAVLGVAVLAYGRSATRSVHPTHVSGSLQGC